MNVLVVPGDAIYGWLSCDPLTKPPTNYRGFGSFGHTVNCIKYDIDAGTITTIVMKIALPPQTVSTQEQSALREKAQALLWDEPCGKTRVLPVSRIKSTGQVRVSSEQRLKYALLDARKPSDQKTYYPMPDNGMNLKESLLQGTLTKEDCIKLALNGYSQLKNLHANKITHGDVKPENMTVKPDGSLRLVDLDTVQPIKMLTSDSPDTQTYGYTLYNCSLQEHEHMTTEEADLIAWFFSTQNDFMIDKFLFFNDNDLSDSDKTSWNSVRSELMRIMKSRSSAINEHTNESSEISDIVNTISDYVKSLFGGQNPSPEEMGEALHVAINSIRPGPMFIKLLLANGADTLVKNKHGNTVLHAAMKTSDEQVIRILIDNGADTLVLNQHGDTVLHAAVIRNNCNIIELLLENGADTLIKNKHGNTVLHAAVYSTCPNLEVIKLLLENGADPSITNNQGDTVLHAAVNSTRPNSQVIKLLLENGADTLIKNKHGNTVLHAAVYSTCPNLEVIKLLLANGADPSITNNQGDTVLHAAINSTRPNPQVIKLLLEKGADTSIKNNQGDTVLHAAVNSTCPNSQVIKLLLENGADPSITNQHGDTALYLAVQKDKSIWYHLYHLLNKNVDVTEKNTEGQSVLHAAILNNQEDDVILLISLINEAHDKMKAAKHALDYIEENPIPTNSLVETIKSLLIVIMLASINNMLDQDNKIHDKSILHQAFEAAVSYGDRGIVKRIADKYPDFIRQKILVESFKQSCTCLNFMVFHDIFWVLFKESLVNCMHVESPSKLTTTKVEEQIFFPTVHAP